MPRCVTRRLIIFITTIERRTRKVPTSLKPTRERAIATLRDSGKPISAALLTAATALLTAATAPETLTEEQSDAEAALTLLSESGRGLRLIYDCVDNVSYRQTAGENCLTLIKRLPASVNGTASAQT